MAVDDKVLPATISVTGLTIRGGGTITGPFTVSGAITFANAVTFNGDVTLAGKITGGWKSVDIAFTNGDTMGRATVTDADVLSSSKIIGFIRRPDTLDQDDPGYIYIYNVVRILNGSFELIIAATDWGFGDPVEVAPNETLKFYYRLG